MPPHDPRRAILITALVPLLRASCPPDAEGYGGSVQLTMPDADAEEFGGTDLIRSALRNAARQLQWKTETFAMTATIHGTMVGVVDRREVPPRFAASVEAHKHHRMRAAVDRVGRPGSGPVPPAPPVDDPHMPMAAFTQALHDAANQAG